MWRGIAGGGNTLLNGSQGGWPAPPIARFRSCALASLLRLRAHPAFIAAICCARLFSSSHHPPHEDFSQLQPPLPALQLPARSPSLAQTSLHPLVVWYDLLFTNPITRNHGNQGPNRYGISILASTPQRWVIDQLVPAQSLVVLWGPAKEGKTTLALQAGCAVTQGTPFLGYDTQRGTVLLLQFDTPRPELTQILIRLSSHGLAMDGLYLPDPDQLDLYKPLNILDKHALFYLQSLIGLVKPSLVIVDCFRELGNFKENERGPTDHCCCPALPHQ